MAYKIFIDGKEGTTGLKIFERFEKRSDIELITIDEDKRKNPEEKAKLINSSDYTFLCLPDAAALESALLCTNSHTKIIDASTAHRTNPQWVYGFPELDKSFREKISKATRVAVPGCYASGSIAICYPLLKSGIIGKDYPILIHAVSGYSGAGKKAIAQYESPDRNKELESPRLYALTQEHKHLKEIKLTWEVASASDYTVQVSTDNNNWFNTYGYWGYDEAWAVPYEWTITPAIEAASAPAAKPARAASAPIKEVPVLDINKIKKAYTPTIKVFP